MRMPRTLVAVATADPMLDEGLACADALREVGALEDLLYSKGSHSLSLQLDIKARTDLKEKWAAMLASV